MSAYCIYIWWHLYLCACCLCYKGNGFQNSCKDTDRLTIKCDNSAARSSCRTQVKSSRLNFQLLDFVIVLTAVLRQPSLKLCYLHFSCHFFSLNTSRSSTYMALSFISVFSAILPNMISRRTGQIVLVNSIQGKIGIPFRAACKLYMAKMHDTDKRLRSVLICILIQQTMNIVFCWKFFK